MGVSLPLVSVLPGDDFRWSILSDPLTRERGYSDGSNVLVFRPASLLVDSSHSADLLGSDVQKWVSFLSTEVLDSGAVFVVLARARSKPSGHSLTMLSPTTELQERLSAGTVLEPSDGYRCGRLLVFHRCGSASANLGKAKVQILVNPSPCSWRGVFCSFGGGSGGREMTPDLSTTAHTLPFSVRQDSGWVGAGVTDPVGSRDLDLGKSSALNPDPVGGLFGGYNGELISMNATFIMTGAQTESSPAAENPGKVTAEIYFPYPVKWFGNGVNGGQLGSFVGDKVSAPETSSSDGGAQGLSSTAYAVMDFMPTITGFGLLNGSDAFPGCASAVTVLNVDAGRSVWSGQVQYRVNEPMARLFSKLGTWLC